MDDPGRWRKTPALPRKDDGAAAPAWRWWRCSSLQWVGAVHAVLVPDRRQYPAVGMAPHGLRPVARPAGPAAAGRPVVAARHPARGWIGHLARRHRAIGPPDLGR